MPSPKEVFSLSPVESSDNFYGRDTEWKKIRIKTEERGCHILISGEKGIGKTTLANSTCYANFKKIDCDRHNDFAEIWSKILQRSVSSIVDILRGMENYPSTKAYIFDNFDRLDLKVQGTFAYLIKYLSDIGSAKTIILVGDGSIANNLWNEHPSTERCVAIVKVPPLEDKDIESMLLDGLDQLNLEIAPVATSRLLKVVNGRPKYLKILAQYCAEYCLLKHQTLIDENVLKQALNRFIDKDERELAIAYEKAVLEKNRQKHFDAKVLSVCASIASTEALFNPQQVTEAVQKIHPQPLNSSDRCRKKLQGFCTEDKGGIMVEKILSGKTKYWYQFADSRILNYIKIRKLANRSVC